MLLISQLSLFLYLHLAFISKFHYPQNLNRSIADIFADSSPPAFLDI